MIELVSISNIYGDCTSDYEIIHSPLDTVGDIIDHATENDEWGNFVINGILNYKKPVKGSDYQIINKYNENQKRFNKLYLRPLIKALIESGVPQCIGKYLLREGEKTIYIDFYPGGGYYENIWNKRQITNIIGVGHGINYDVVNTQGGKTKYLCSIDTSLVFGRPDICFYFKK